MKIKFMAVIKTKEFILRPFKKGDENSLKKNIDNEKIYKNTLTIPHPYTLKNARDWVAKNLKLARASRPTEINFALDIGGEVVGGVGIRNIEEQKAEIDYWIAEKCWGKGLATRAVKLATNFAFKKMGLKRVYGYAFSFNKASQRVLEKAGYRLEGVLRKNSKKGNRLIDDFLYAKIRKK